MAATNSLGTSDFDPADPFKRYNGDFILLRYTDSGVIDSSFGVNGMITTDFIGLQDNPNDMAVQQDGKVVLCGRTSDSTRYRMGLCRYNFNILPVHLLTFTAKLQQDKVNLNWKVENEVSFDRYEVERSTNGKEFSKIGTVKAVNAKEYSLIDPLNEKQETRNLYYRLKMMDKDGKFTYSPVRSVNNTRSFYVSVYPNPAKDKLQLQIESDKKETLQVQVVSQDGKVLLSNELTIQQGNSVQALNISALSAGHYFLRVTSVDKEKSVVKFEKM